MTKKFHMLTHLSQALVLEEELFEDQDLEYAEEFSKDFLKEQMFLSEMKMKKGLYVYPVWTKIEDNEGDEQAKEMEIGNVKKDRWGNEMVWDEKEEAWTLF